MKMLIPILLLTAGTAWADADFYAQASASDTNIFLGEVFNLDVVVKAESKPAMPPFQSADFNAAALVDGQPTSAAGTWFFRYALRPKTAGGLTIPALNFNRLYTQPIRIRAHKPELTDRMVLKQTVSTNSVYVGEPIVLRTVWDSTYQFGAVKAVDFHFPILNDKRFQVLEIHDPEKESRTDATGLPVHGTRVLAERHSYQAGDVQHQTLEFSKILVPRQSGRITVSPATLLCAADKEAAVNNKTRRSAFQYPAYFDNTFFDQNVTGDQWSRIYTESDPIEIEVKPLPKEGRPDLFNGMVGRFSIEVTAEPTDVQVGEPITLTIKITAANRVETIFFEPLRYQPNLVNRFEIPSDRALPTIEGQHKIYTQTIRPLSTSSTEVPPLQLAYFDPSAGAYAVAESEAVALNVSPADEVGVFGSAGYKSRLQAVNAGIRQNYENPDMLRTRRRPLFGWVHPAAAVPILLLPPVLFAAAALAALLGSKKHHIHRTAKAARAFKVFRRNAAQLKTRRMKTEIYRGLDECLRAYLGDRLHLVPGALAFRDAAAALQKAGADSKDIQKLQQLFSVCEAYRFTSGYDQPADPRPIIAAAVETVRALERSLKS